MSIVIDVILVLILLICTLIGYKKGFIKISVTAIGLIASVILSIILSSTVATWTYETFIEEKMVTTISEGLEEQGNASIDEAIDNLFSSNKMINKMAKICDIAPEDVKPEISSDSKGVATVTDYIEQEVVRPTFTFMLRVISMVLLFIITSLLFNLLAKLLSKAFSLKTTKKADPLFGGILGLLLGLVFAILFCILIDTLISLFPDGFIGITSQTRDNSYIYRLVNSVSKWYI